MQNNTSSINSLLNEKHNLRSPLLFSQDLKLEGKPIQWEKLHWLKTILMDLSPDIRIQKASQMGVSTLCLIRSFWMLKTKTTPRGIIYWLPTAESVSDFVKTKIDPFIADNDELQDNRSTRKSDANNQGLKFLYEAPFFVRGLKSRTAVKSISADAAIYDEFDEADPEQVVQARKRLSASDKKISIDLSTPILPDFGINKRFMESDQRHYAFKCPGCSRYNVLEQNWPHTFKQDAKGDYFAACKPCGAKLDLTKGEWFATSQEPVRGYQISQLYSPFVSPNDIMHEYHTTEFMGHFFNHVIGLPYLSATDRVTVEMVLALCEPPRPMSAGNLKPTAMGVDVGSLLHTTIIEPGSPHKVIWAGELRTFEELDAIMLKFNVRQSVFDALPEMRKVREFIARHKNKAWMCFYAEHQKGSYAWDEEDRKVSVNRTESLDVGTEAILNKKITLPQRNPMLETFATHCANVVKVPEENKETGEKRYIYKKIGADHFRHSLNYALIAASLMRTGGVVSVYR